MYPDELHEARFIQTRHVTSAANDETAMIAVAVPEGKIWTILSGLYYPSVNETQYVWWSLTSHGMSFPFTQPQNISLFPWALPAVREGMEIKLFPGETIGVGRGSHTVGSTMFVAIRYIETDLPLYDYVEPQEAKRLSVFKRGLVGRASSAARIPGSAVAGRVIPGRGGRGGESK